jgi:hypothetical protein
VEGMMGEDEINKNTLDVDGELVVVKEGTVVYITESTLAVSISRTEKSMNELLRKAAATERDTTTLVTIVPSSIQNIENKSISSFHSVVGRHYAKCLPAFGTPPQWRDASPKHCIPEVVAVPRHIIDVPKQDTPKHRDPDMEIKRTPTAHIYKKHQLHLHWTRSNLLIEA